MSVKVRTKGAEKAGWQRSLASRTPKSIILGAVAWLNFSANATAPGSDHFGLPPHCCPNMEKRLHSRLRRRFRSFYSGEALPGLRSSPILCIKPLYSSARKTREQVLHSVGEGPRFYSRISAFSWSSQRISVLQPLFWPFGECLS